MDDLTLSKKMFKMCMIISLFFCSIQRRVKRRR